MTNQKGLGTGPFGLPEGVWPQAAPEPLHPAGVPVTEGGNVTSVHLSGSGGSDPPPLNAEFKPHKTTPGEGTPVIMTLRWFIFEAAMKLLRGGVELGRFLLGVLVRLGNLLFETLDGLRKILFQLLTNIVKDWKWLVVYLTIAFACWVSYATQGVLWATGDVIKSHICTHATSGRCSDDTTTPTVTPTVTSEIPTTPEPEPTTVPRARRGADLARP